MKTLNISNGHDCENDHEEQESATLLRFSDENEWEGEFERIVKSKRNKTKVPSTGMNMLWSYVVVGIFICVVALSAKTWNSRFDAKDILVVETTQNETNNDVAPDNNILNTLDSTESEVEKEEKNDIEKEKIAEEELSDVDKIDENKDSLEGEDNNSQSLDSNSSLTETNSSTDSETSSQSEVATVTSDNDKESVREEQKDPVNTDEKQEPTQDEDNTSQRIDDNPQHNSTESNDSTEKEKLVNSETSSQSEPAPETTKSNSDETNGDTTNIGTTNSSEISETTDNETVREEQKDPVNTDEKQEPTQDEDNISQSIVDSAQPNSTESNDSTENEKLINSETESQSEAAPETKNGTTDETNGETTNIDTTNSSDKSEADVETTNKEESATHENVAISTAKEGFRKHPAKLSDTYLPRASRPMTDEQKQKLTEKWGSWTLKSPPITENIPVDQYPNGDVPSKAFPQNAWQTNPEFLKDWLPHSIALVERAMEAILSEYGNGKDDRPNSSFEERSFMFSLTIFNSSAEEHYSSKGPKDGNGGYATKPTLAAIKRRLLRAIMLEDTFIFAMGGHSAAAGHGNHFQQSYTLQAQKVLEPVLARLGVYHQAHNFGFGGLGTLQNGLAVGDMYGKNLDILMWDSGMTEGDPQSKDMFVRQAVLGTNRIPVIWSRPYDRYQQKVPELGFISTGYAAWARDLPQTEDEIQAKTVPWAARYLNCSRDALDLCAKSRYVGQCWVDRDDVVPPTTQGTVPGGQASWHPGNRQHQVQGRSIAFVILQQLWAGLNEWQNTENYALPDEAWHIGDEHDRMRAAVLEANDTDCFKGLWPAATCNAPMNGRSEFTPRFNPAETSIRTLIMDGVKIPEPLPNIYDPPDVPNLDIEPPEGEIDVVRIIENGIEFSPNKGRRAMVNDVIASERNPRQRVISKTDLPPGQGWGLDSTSAPDNCDGTYDSFCGRSASMSCLLSGHNDHRGFLLFDSYSGWLKLHLPNVTHGLVFVEIYWWLGPKVNQATDNFTCENNYNCGEGSRQLRDANNCFTYTFEYAIDGKVTSWTKDEFVANTRTAQRVVPLYVFLEDPAYTENREDKSVELAIRMLGCKRESTFALTHVYWS